MKETNIILLNKSLSDSAEAMSYCVSKRRKNGVINQPGSSWFKKGSDVKDIVVIGHTGVDETNHPVERIGGLTFDEFWEQFDREFVKSGGNKEDVKHIWIIGCSFGLMLGEKSAQKAYEMGYTNAVILAATPNSTDDEIVGTVVQITHQKGMGDLPVGALTLIGYTEEDLQRKTEIKEQINSTLDENVKKELENDLSKVGKPILVSRDAFDGLSQPQNRYVSNESHLKEDLLNLNIVKKQKEPSKEENTMEMEPDFSQKYAYEQIKAHYETLKNNQKTESESKKDKKHKHKKVKKKKDEKETKEEKNLGILELLLTKLEKHNENWKEVVLEDRKRLEGNTTKKFLKDVISHSTVEGKMLERQNHKEKPVTKRKKLVFFENLDETSMSTAVNIEKEQVTDYLQEYIDVLKYRLESRKTKLGFLHDWFPGMIQDKINGLEEIVAKLEPKEAIDKTGIQNFINQELEANPNLGRYGLGRSSSRTQTLLNKIISDDQPEEYITELKREVPDGYRKPNEDEEENDTLLNNN